MSMSEQRSGRSRWHREEEEPANAPGQAKRPKPDNQVSAITDDVLEDIDRALEEQLFNDGEEVTPEELEKRIDSMIKAYVQTGGQ